MPKSSSTAPPRPAACLPPHLNGIKVAFVRQATALPPRRTRFRETRTVVPHTPAAPAAGVIFFSRFLVRCSLLVAPNFPTCAPLTCLWSATCLDSSLWAAACSQDGQFVSPLCHLFLVPRHQSRVTVSRLSPVSSTGRNLGGGPRSIWKGRPRLPQRRYTSEATNARRFRNPPGFVVGW